MSMGGVAREAVNQVGVRTGRFLRIGGAPA